MTSADIRPFTIDILAWNGQLFDDTLDDDFVLTNVALYWLTGTAGSSIRFYYDNAHAQSPAGPTTIPIALATAADGDFKSIRRFADRDHTNNRAEEDRRRAGVGHHQKRHQAVGEEPAEGFAENVPAAA